MLSPFVFNLEDRHCFSIIVCVISLCFQPRRRTLFFHHCLCLCYLPLFSTWKTDIGFPSLSVFSPFVFNLEDRHCFSIMVCVYVISLCFQPRRRTVLYQFYSLWFDVIRAGTHDLPHLSRAPMLTITLQIIDFTDIFLALT